MLSALLYVILYKIGGASAIEASFIALDLHYLCRKIGCASPTNHFTL